MRSFMGYPRTFCDCRDCALNCQYIPGYLLEDDLSRIAAFHGIHLNPLLDWRLQSHEIRQFVMQSFLASPGALVLRNGKPCRIRTLVPARNDNDWCKFFDGRFCTIHRVAPFGCAFFDAHQTRERSNTISAKGLTILARMWVEEPGSLYCQIWSDLYTRRLRAPSPEECRNKMRNRHA